MSSKISVVLFLSLGSLLVVSSALAHHSVAAEFDSSKEFTVTGVLTKVEWVNPHLFFFVNAKDETGKVVEWSFEGHPPGMAQRAGLTKDKFIIGAQVTVTGVPLKDGTKHLGYGKKIKYLSDGHEIIMYATGRELPVD